MNEGITPFNAFNTVINVLMGTGPLVLPPAVAAAGLGLGTILLIIMAIISVITAEYLVECLSVANYLNNTNTSTEQQMADMVDPKEDLITSESSKQFHMHLTYEYGMLGKLAWSRFGELFNAINLILYLYGVLITKGIIVGNTLSQLFSNTPVIGEYYFWVSLFYLISSLLSFRDVAHIAIVQTTIAIFRYFTMLTMLIGSLISIGYYGISDIKYFDFHNFSNLFGATVFSYLIQHSIPSMLRPVHPQQQIQTIIHYAFTLAFSVFFILCLTGMLAFPELCSDHYYNDAFQQPHTMSAYYIISFYIFLNISALPVLTITIRKNMMKLCLPDRTNKNELALNLHSVIFTLIVILPTFILAMTLRNNISFVIGITGGVCGVIVLMIIPSFMVVSFRKLCPQLNPFQSNVHSNTIAYFIGIMGIGFVPYNLYVQINKLIHPAVLCQ